MSKCYFCEQNKQVTWIFRLKDDRVRKSHKQFLEQVKPRIKPPLLSIPKDSLDGYYNCSGEYIFKKMNNENKLPEVGKIYVLKTCKSPFVLKEIKSSGNQHQLESEATRTHEQKQQGKGRFIVKNNSIREFWKMFEELPDQEPTEESSKETSDNVQEALEEVTNKLKDLEKNRFFTTSIDLEELKELAQNLVKAIKQNNNQEKPSSKSIWKQAGDNVYEDLESLKHFIACRDYCGKYPPRDGEEYNVSNALQNLVNDKSIVFLDTQRTRNQFKKWCYNQQEQLQKRVEKLELLCEQLTKED